MSRGQKDFTFDASMQLKDAGAVTADAAAQVASAARVVDLGAARFDGRVVVDVSAVDVASGDELYSVAIQLSNSQTFASGVVGGPGLRLGHSSVLPGETASSAAGRYEFAFSNEINGTVYRYARAYTDVSGTTPSINYIAFVVQNF